MPPLSKLKATKAKAKAKAKHSLATAAPLHPKPLVISLGSGYTVALDRTLTPHQRSIRGFRPDAWIKVSENFRYASNPTLSGHNSGYHEAAVTTDTLEFLRRAVKQPNGTYKLPATASKGSLFEQHVGTTVSGIGLETVLKFADGFRTDTAETALSASGGRAAGHSGSGLELAGQADAHDLLRAMIMRIIKLDPKTKGLTEKSIVATMAAMVATSIAPGVLAEQLRASTGASLKAGEAKQARWEADRNEMKARAQALLEMLGPDEQAFVQARSAEFLQSTQVGVSPANARRLGPARSTSPMRDTSGTPGTIRGRGYSPANAGITTSLSPASLAAEPGLSVTQPFRSARW